MDFFSLRVEDAEFGPDGIRGFHWPMSLVERKDVFEALLAGLNEEVQTALAADLQGALELKVILPYLISECLHLYQAKVIVDGFRREARELRLPPGMRVLPAVLADRALELSPLVNALKTGAEQKKWTRIFRKPKKIWKKRTQRHGAKVQKVAVDSPSVSRMEFQGAAKTKIPSLKWGWMARFGVISTKRGALYSLHAASLSSGKVRYKDAVQWFGPCPDKPKSPLHPDLRVQMLDRITECIKGGGVVLPDYCISYLATYMDTACGYVRIHLERLRKMYTLPRKLWTGSNGIVWNRMLRIAVRERGGLVWGHDHAGGTAYLNLGFKQSLEYQDGDAFVTFSRAQKELYEKDYSKEMAPDVCAIENVRYESPVEFPMSVGGEVSKVSSVMYVAGSCQYEPSLSYGMKVAPIVEMDWLARLFSKLSAFEYDVLYKTHPEDTVRLPLENGESWNIHRVEGILENCLEMSDVLIFPIVATTAFNVALLTDKPLVLLDFMNNWSAEILDQLKERVAIVRGWYDVENRMQVDWQELTAAIERAPRLAKNASFCTKYLSVL